MKINRSILFLILIIMIAVIIFSFVSQESLWANRQLVSEPLHTTVESLCGLAAIVIAIFLFQRKGEKYGGKLFLIALGFLSTGILDIFHGATVLGHGFVLLRSVSTLVCSFWFVLIWFPQLASDKDMAWKRWAAVAVSGVSIFFAVWTLAARETLPVMVVGGKFTVAAVACNITAGVFFLAASVRFLIDFFSAEGGSGKLEIYLFACMALLFGLAGLMFPFSTVWDSTWWMWHLLRVIAYAVVLVSVIREYRFMASDLRVALEESNQAEEALRETNEYLENLFNYANAPIIVWDTSFIITRFNHAFEKLSGYNAAEVRGKKIDLLFPKDKIDFSIDLIKKTVSGERWETVEIEILRKDGEVKTVLWNSANIFDKEGREVVATIAQGYDITERKRAEESLQISEVRYRRLFEAAKDGILILDVDTGEIADVNPYLVDMLGYSAEELLGKKLWEISPFKDIAANQVTFDQLKRQEYVRYEDLPLQSRDGHSIQVEFVSNIYSVGSTRVIQCNIRDITKRKRAEEELHKSEKKYRDLVENALVGIYRTNLHGEILFVNEAIVKMLEYNSREEFIQSSAFSRYKNPDDRKRLIETLMKKGSVNNFEIEILTKNGNAKTVLISATLDEDVLSGMVRDITERKQAEEEIRKLNAELEQRVNERTAQLEIANKEMEAFTYSVSHDLRGPLRAIDGFSKIMLEDYEARLDDEGKRLLKIICTNTQKMDQLITDLLSLSRVSRIEIDFSRIDMTTLAKSIYHEIASADVQKKFIFKVTKLPDVFGSATLMRQVWSNLLSNAIKFTLPKNVRIIEIGSYKEKGKNIYFVKDSGVGFNPEYTHKIFDVFQRLHKVDEFEGTGVGLAIVQRIIHRHKGEVWAEGKINEGATFYFSLPDGK